MVIYILDDQLTHLRRLYEMPEGLEARKKRHVGKKDAITTLLAAVMSELEVVGSKDIKTSKQGRALFS